MSQDLEVLFTVENSVGWITLNRPKALNALSYEMVLVIREKLQQWKNDDNVLLICITGTGGKALCAGSDIRAIYNEKNSRGDARALARAFFSAQYDMDYLIHSYQKPCIVIMDGIVMGGGVGISIGCSHRIATENTKWAMPEMNIGFFPDVGASYFLNKMPGQVGRYLALTAETITAADALYVGAADHYFTVEALNSFLEFLRTTHWKKEFLQETLENALRTCSSRCPNPSTLQQNQSKIDAHFNHEQVEDIITSLTQASLEHCEWSREKLTMLKQKSPTSLKVALEQNKRGKALSLPECFQMEIELGVQFMQQQDFFEGVRAVLVDKDRNPQWSPNRLEDVSFNMVEAYFPTPVQPMVATEIS